MATIAKPRHSVNNVRDDFFDPQPAPTIIQPPKSTAPRGGMGKPGKVLKDDSIKNSGQYNGDKDEPKTLDQGIASDEPTAHSAGNQSIDTDSKAGGKGYNKSVSLLEQEEAKRRATFSELKRKSINQGAEELLSCLEPNFANEFRIAAMEHRVADIGIYILGILNRLSKEVDFNNPDFEVEWEQGVVGYTDVLKCNYCGKEIINPTKLKQKFCTNLCAKYYREQGDTGVVYPDEFTVPSETPEEQERKAYEEELKRTGGG